MADDREDYTNGQPVRMKKLARKRRSLQKRLMGSTESLEGLDELAASRASKMSAIFSNILKSQMSHLHQWKPESNGPVLLKVAILVN